MAGKGVDYVLPCFRAFCSFFLAYSLPSHAFCHRQGGRSHVCRTQQQEQPLARHGIPARARLGISQNPSLALSLLADELSTKQIGERRRSPFPSLPLPLALSGKQLFGPMGGEAEEGDVSARDTRFRGEGGGR